VRKINLIVVHVSDSFWGSSTEIEKWHTFPRDNGDGTATYLGRRYPSRDDLPLSVRREQGNGWSSIGYHRVVTNGYPLWNDWNSKTYRIEWDGKVADSLPEEQAGIHAAGYNNNSLSICYIGRGRDPITPKQRGALAREIYRWLWKYDLRVNNVLGHYELDPRKTCPNMDMDLFREWLRGSRLQV
jgi:N-acetylmuramoyl-L-alanine amidase